jgi:hypothetical protein
VRPVNFVFWLNPALNWDAHTLTFISVPKPQKLTDQIEMAKIVLRVWLTYPFTRIILYTTEAEYDPNHMVVPFVREMFGTDRLVFAGNLPGGYEGRALVREWFLHGFRQVKAGYICFLNGDIIIPPLWMNSAMAIFNAFGEAERRRVLIYGTRTDVHRRPGVFWLDAAAPRWIWELTDWLGRNARGNNPYGMDVVLVHSSFNALRWTELPDFVIGMCVWDNFFMGWADKRATTVSMNFEAKMYHVDHPPNACNDQNYEYFRAMSYRSKLFAGFHEHSVRGPCSAWRRRGSGARRGVCPTCRSQRSSTTQSGQSSDRGGTVG